MNELINFSTYVFYRKKKRTFKGRKTNNKHSVTSIKLDFKTRTLILRFSFNNFRTRYRASLKNGVLVEDERGPLIVTHNYYHVYNNNNDGCNLNQESLHSDQDQDYPLDLSTKLLEPKIEAKIESADTTASCPSPCLIDLTVKKNVEPDTSCQTQVRKILLSKSL